MSDYYCQKKKKETSGHYFPDEIIHEILLRLPASSLLKFRFVCKSWNSLIKDSAFIRTHLKHSIQSSNKNDDVDRLLAHALVKKKYGSSREFFTLQCDGDEYSTGRVIPTKMNWGELHATGTCNGLVCLVFVDFKHLISIPMIWNPFVRKIVIVPNQGAPSHAYRVHYELGYDPKANDYKLLQIAVPHYRPHNPTPCQVQVFSLLEGSWKNLNAPASFRPPIHDLNAAVISGALHWLSGSQSFEGYDQDACIATFDMSTELFGEMMVPEALKINPQGWYKSRYKESQLALLHQDGNGVVDLWVMKQYGVAESWTKLWTISIPYSLQHKSLYFRKSGELMIGEVGHRVHLLDPKSKHFKKSIKVRRILSIKGPLVESLVLLDRSDARSF